MHLLRCPACGPKICRLPCSTTGVFLVSLPGGHCQKWRFHVVIPSLTIVIMCTSETGCSCFRCHLAHGWGVLGILSSDVLLRPFEPGNYFVCFPWIRSLFRDFLVVQVVRILHCQWHGTGSIHGQGTMIPHATTKTWCRQEKEILFSFWVIQFLFSLNFIFWLSASACSKGSFHWILFVRGKVYRNKMGKAALGV